MATRQRIVGQAPTADEGPIGKLHPVGVIREDLIATIWPQYQTVLRGLGITAQTVIDLLRDPTRLGTHVSLHQLAIDQVKAMAIGHRQQVLGSITLRYHGRMHHATYYFSRLQNLSGEFSCRFMILPSTPSPLAYKGRVFINASFTAALPPVAGGK